MAATTYVARVFRVSSSWVEVGRFLRWLLRKCHALKSARVATGSFCGSSCPSQPTSSGETFMNKKAFFKLGLVATVLFWVGLADAQSSAVLTYDATQPVLKFAAADLQAVLVQKLFAATTAALSQPKPYSSAGATGTAGPGAGQRQHRRCHSHAIGKRHDHSGRALTVSISVVP